MNRWRDRCLLTGLLAGSAWLAGLSGCSGGGSGLSNDTPVVGVQTTTAKVQRIDDIVQAQGVLYPVHQASLSPKVSAPVLRFYVNRGSRVRQGQLLAVLSNKDLAAGVVAARGIWDQAQANYESTTSSTLPEEIQAAEASLRDAQSSLDEEQKLYDSDSNLYREGAIPRRQLEATAVALTAAKSAWETAQKHLDDLKKSGAEQQQRAAKGQMESARGQYLGAVAQLGYTELRSPIDGVIADRSVYPGDIAPAGTPLLVVMDTSKVILRLHLPQPEAAQLHLGDAATLEVPGFAGGVPAKVTIISPALDPSSTTIEVWLQADNPKGRLAPGTSVGATVLVRSVPNALVIPDSAILTGDNGQDLVMTVGPDDLAHAQPVTTGIKNAGLVQILKGLRPGEQVIVGGAYGLPDKTKVKPSPEQSNAAEGQD